MSSISAFISSNVQLIDSTLILNGGLRYSSFSLDARYKRSDPFDWPETFYTGISNSNDAFNGALGLTFQKSKWLWRAQIASAFRNPNIDDFVKIRIKRNDATVPNIELTSETAFNIESTIAYYFDQAKKNNISITAFRSSLKDAIIRTDFQLPNGADTINIDGEVFNVEANVNAESGFIYGVSTNLKWHWNNFKFRGSFNYTKGRTKDEQGALSPLAHIPPVYGQLSLAYQTDRFQIQLLNRFNGSKPLDQYGGSADNPDFATPQGAPAWNTFNIYSNFAVSEKFTVNLGVENIFDTHYRTFSSGISASGINFLIGLRGSI
ncbi:MAG: TonB-dependent receptor [Bacteroidota bacterium]